MKYLELHDDNNSIVCLDNLIELCMVNEEWQECTKIYISYFGEEEAKEYDYTEKEHKKHKDLVGALSISKSEQIIHDSAFQKDYEAIKKYLLGKGKNNT